MKNTNKIARLLGFSYERKAETFLKNHELRLIARNYNCRFGEIDLIMTDHKTLVFIEVRLRKNEKFGRAIETVDNRKQQKIIQTAKVFLQKNLELDYDSVRFDVIGIKNTITWVKNAFGIDF